MELVVDDPRCFDGLTEDAYRLIQRGAGLEYRNTRLLRRGAQGARYLGVTHEYLDVPSGRIADLDGAWFRDHMDGANRPGKFDRDIDLLRRGLQDEPDNARYVYYLAQSFRDSGRMAEAAQHYKRRAEMGGWDEEVWHARLQLARCWRDMGDERHFLHGALHAFEARPTRPEPLADLARFYREKGGCNELAALFAARGLQVPHPTDLLFND